VGLFVSTRFGLAGALVVDLEADHSAPFLVGRVIIRREICAKKESPVRGSPLGVDLRVSGDQDGLSQLGLRLRDHGLVLALGALGLDVGDPGGSEASDVRGRDGGGGDGLDGHGKIPVLRLQWGLITGHEKPANCREKRESPWGLPLGTSSRRELDRSHATKGASSCSRNDNDRAAHS